MNSTLLNIMSIILTVSGINLLAQDDVYYVILTSQQLKEERITKDGIYKTSLERKSESQKSPSIFFTVASPDRKIEEIFRHADYDIEKLKAHRGRNDPKNAVIRPDEIMDTKIMPISFLETIKPIDLDKEFPKLTYESAEKLLEPLRGKKIYIIDRNDVTEKNDITYWRQAPYLSSGQNALIKVIKTCCFPISFRIFRVLFPFLLQERSQTIIAKVRIFSDQIDKKK